MKTKRLCFETKYSHSFLTQKIKGVSEVLQSETGLDFVKDASECEISFVVANFEGELFSKLHRAQVRIIGPQVLKKCVQDGIVSTFFLAVMLFHNIVNCACQFAYEIKGI